MFARSIASCSRRVSLALLLPSTTGSSGSIRVGAGSRERRMYATGPYKGKIGHDAKGRRYLAPRIPEPPKRNRNAFTLWSNAYLAEPQVKAEYSIEINNRRRIDYPRFMRDASAKWKDMTSEEREPYVHEEQMLRQIWEEDYAAYWNDTTDSQRETARNITGLLLRPPKARGAEPKAVTKGRPKPGLSKRSGYAIFMDEKLYGEGGIPGRRPTMKEASEMWRRLDDRSRYRYTMMAEQMKDVPAAVNAMETDMAEEEEFPPPDGRQQSGGETMKKTEKRGRRKKVAPSEGDEEES